MKRFIRKIGVFLLLFATVSMICSVLVFSFSVPQYRWNYNASLIDKVERLENLKKGKIILVGNSNLAFGIDSEKIEKELGMPVVNLGLHGGLGNIFHEEIVKRNLCEGDLVVLCHTDYSKSYITEPDLVWPMVEQRLDLLEFISPKDYFSVLKALPPYLQWSLFYKLDGSGNQESGDCYSRKEFNEYGDNVYPRPSLVYQFTEGSIKVPEIDDENMKRINELNTYCRKKGAHLLIAGYPVGKGIYTPPVEKYKEFQKELESKMECEVISDFSDYFFEYEYFYDTALHLNDEGVKMRTNQLISDLKEWMYNYDSMD